MRSHAYETLIVPAAQALTMFAVSPFAEREGSVRRNGGGGHLQNILLLRAALQQTGVIVVDARSAADAAAKDDTRLADGAVRQPAVAHSLVGRMQAKADGAVIFGRGKVRHSAPPLPHGRRSPPSRRT